MNFEEHEKSYQIHYRRMASTVRHIIEEAIKAANIPKPQSIQARAKSPIRLRARLKEAGQIGREDIEQVRRDLAGVRLIFYTNSDVDAFMRSGLLFGNFEIEKGATKLHHQTPENDRVRYRAIHYTVRLREERVKLPEYARFAGLRCEIQIQTILNHAWSETTHDILYKSERSVGFGKAAMDRLEKRINNIMDKYLMPAGYEFQRVQHDYERLKQGKALFDRNVIETLGQAKDNNERYDILTALKDDMLPNFDDTQAIYHDLHGPLIEAVKAARETAVIPITTPFGELRGHSAADVTRLIVDIFD
jgi:ppGpp synthetase/RelA/SpoT-type nucleotidyltranferase